MAQEINAVEVKNKENGMSAYPRIEGLMEFLGGISFIFKVY